MDVQTFEGVGSYAHRAPFFSQIRWSAVFAGAVAGTATYLLLAVFGVAIGLSAVEPQAAEPVGNVPVLAGIWTLVSLVVSSFTGGYISAHMSGLARRSDGLLHGFVAWGATTVLFVWLATTAIGSALGGTLSVLGQGASAAGQAVGGGESIQSIIGGAANPQAVGTLRERLRAGDREGAISVMTDQMGMAPDQANSAADRLMPIMGPQGGQNLRQAASGAVNSLQKVSWWLFFSLLLGLMFGLWGGASGSRSVSRRATEDHSDERYLRIYP